MPMVDIAVFTTKHIKRLIIISHVSNKVMSDFFKILSDYRKAKCNLVVFYIEPITAHLIYLIDDKEFNVDNLFMTFHLCDKLWFYHSSYLKVQTMVEP